MSIERPRKEMFVEYLFKILFPFIILNIILATGDNIVTNVIVGNFFIVYFLTSPFYGGRFEFSKDKRLYTISALAISILTFLCFIQIIEFYSHLQSPSEPVKLHLLILAILCISITMTTTFIAKRVMSALYKDTQEKILANKIHKQHVKSEKKTNDKQGIFRNPADGPVMLVASIFGALGSIAEYYLHKHLLVNPDLLGGVESPAYQMLPLFSGNVNILITFLFITLVSFFAITKTRDKWFKNKGHVN